MSKRKVVANEARQVTWGPGFKGIIVGIIWALAFALGKIRNHWSIWEQRNDKNRF